MRLAQHVHKFGSFWVRREYAPGGSEKRQRVDIAMLISSSGLGGKTQDIGVRNECILQGQLEQLNSKCTCAFWSRLQASLATTFGNFELDSFQLAR